VTGSRHESPQPSNLGMGPQAKHLPSNFEFFFVMPVGKKLKLVRVLSPLPFEKAARLLASAVGTKAQGKIRKLYGYFCGHTTFITRLLKPSLRREELFSSATSQK